MLAERWLLSTDVAYLPWTDFIGRDNHLLRAETTFTEQRGNGGGGVQLEGALSYFVTSNFSIGFGARYWAMWTKRDAWSMHCERLHRALARICEVQHGALGYILSGFIQIRFKDLISAGPKLSNATSRRARKHRPRHHNNGAEVVGNDGEAPRNRAELLLGTMCKPRRLSTSLRTKIVGPTRWHPSSGLP